MEIVKQILSCKLVVYLKIKEFFSRMQLVTLVTLSGCQNNCSYFDRVVYRLINTQSYVIHMSNYIKASLFISRLENATKKIQPSSNMIYEKTFFVARVSIHEFYE